MAACSGPSLTSTCSRCHPKKSTTCPRASRLGLGVEGRGLRAWGLGVGVEGRGGKGLGSRKRNLDERAALEAERGGHAEPQLPPQELGPAAVARWAELWGVELAAETVVPDEPPEGRVVGQCSQRRIQRRHPLRHRRARRARAVGGLDARHHHRIHLRPQSRPERVTRQQVRVRVPVRGRMRVRVREHVRVRARARDARGRVEPLDLHLVDFRHAHLLEVDGALHAAHCLRVARPRLQRHPVPRRPRKGLLHPERQRLSTKRRREEEVAEDAGEGGGASRRGTEQLWTMLWRERGSVTMTSDNHDMLACHTRTPQAQRSAAHQPPPALASHSTHSPSPSLGALCCLPSRARVQHRRAFPPAIAKQRARRSARSGLRGAYAHARVAGRLEPRVRERRLLIGVRYNGRVTDAEQVPEVGAELVRGARG
eukprot:3738841-Rhodomonas_salina.2